MHWKLYQTHEINNWSQLQTVLVDVVPRHWVFRGHADAAWQLEPTIRRYAVGVSPLLAEARVRSAFKRRAHLYLSRLPEDDIEWLSVMQHYGAPTRLLDWTRSPYVAAFFALEDALKPSGHSAIWAVDLSWCDGQFGRFLSKRSPEQAKTVEPSALDAFGRFVGRNPKGFEDFIVNVQADAVVSVEATRDTERIANQQGLFLAQGNLDRSFLWNLASPDLPSAQYRIKKFLISNSVRSVALKELARLMNISRASLFPGLDGFAQSMRGQVIEPTPSQASHGKIMSLLGNYQLHKDLFPDVFGDLESVAGPNTSVETSEETEHQD